MSSLVLPRTSGLAVDHVALGVPDMPAALGQIASDTGATPFTTEPEPGQWYWSGALALGPDSFFEILGPNPDFKGFHPLRALISSYTKPRVLFWYVATSDFDGFTEQLKQAGAPMERVETINFMRDNIHTHYKRGVIGPGFVTQRPCVIEWREKQERLDVDRRCQLKAFRLQHPNAAKLNTLFGALGINQCVEEGPSWVGVELSTPNGTVVYENAGEDFVGIGAMLRMAGLYLRWIGKCGRASSLLW